LEERVSASPQLSDTQLVRPFDPSRFMGQIQYDGATEIKVAAVAAHRTGELVALSLVGNDTAISARLAKLFVNEKITFVPSEEITWDGPRILSRLGSNYRRLVRRLSGVRNTMHYLVFPNHANIGFNLQNPPEIPSDLLPKPEGQAALGTPLVAKPESKPTYRYVFASPLPAEEAERGVVPVPSFGTVLGTFVGMRMIVLRSREPAMQPIVRQWVNNLWWRGLAQGLVEPLPAAGMYAWGLKNNLLQWNTLVSQGVTDGWLPLPAGSRSLSCDEVIALAAD
jgi:hypothetical protein